jgi:hypothetical protein
MKTAFLIFNKLIEDGRHLRVPGAVLAFVGHGYIENIR